MNMFTLLVSSKRPLITRVFVISSHSLFRRSFSFSSSSASSICSCKVWDFMKGPLAVEELLVLLFALFEVFTDVDVLIEEVSDLLD